jgi:hypothetical protein
MADDAGSESSPEGAADRAVGGPAAEESGPEAVDGPADTDDVDIPDDVDFDDFGPADMAKLSANEWAAAFDPDTWITGQALLDRVEGELRSRVASREVFAAIERPSADELRAVSDEGWATVHADGTVEGSGTVLRDVKPTVALCSMPDYDPAAGEGELPDPATVTRGSSRLGDLMLQVIAGVLLLAGLILLGGAVVGAMGTSGALGVIAGLGFLVAGLVLFVAVANARLSGRFRAEEFRERLRQVDAARERGDEAGERVQPEPSDAAADGPERPGPDTAIDGDDGH